MEDKEKKAIEHSVSSTSRSFIDNIQYPLSCSTKGTYPTCRDGSNNLDLHALCEIASTDDISLADLGVGLLTTDTTTPLALRSLIELSLESGSELIELTLVFLAHLHRQHTSHQLHTYTVV